MCCRPNQSAKEISSRAAPPDSEPFLTPELQQIAASQSPHAASTRMAVNNCHMLQYRAEKGTQPDQSHPVSQPNIAVPPPVTLQRNSSFTRNLQTSSSPVALLQQKPQKFGGVLQSKVHPSALVTISHGEITLHFLAIWCGDLRTNWGCAGGLQCIDPA